MQLVKLYFSPALLLLLLTCPLWQVGQSSPVMRKGPITESCVLHAQTLLRNITDTLTQKNLFSGIDCTQQSVELNMETDTPTACAPKESKCSRIVQSEYDEDSCLTNIGEDLRHYYKFLAAQPDPSDLITVLSSLRELMENCIPSWSLPTDMPSKEAADRQSTFDERLTLCKVLKGFRVRTMTINRAIGYMKSEHTK